MRETEPVFNVPRAVVAVLVVLAGVHLLRAGLSPGYDRWLVHLLAFIPARYTGATGGLPGGMLAEFASPLTHTLIHGDVLHLGVNSLALLAFGGGIAHRIGGARFLAFFFFCGAAGAALFFAINPYLKVPMVGASGAISGMLGGVMRFSFSQTDYHDASLAERAVHSPLMPLALALRNQRILITTVVIILMNILTIAGINFAGTDAAIAWEAHVGGYLAGLLTFGFFDVPQHRISQSHNKPTLQ